MTEENVFKTSLNRGIELREDGELELALRFFERMLTRGNLFDYEKSEIYTQMGITCSLLNYWLRAFDVFHKAQIHALMSTGPHRVVEIRRHMAVCSMKIGRDGRDIATSTRSLAVGLKRTDTVWFTHAVILTNRPYNPKYLSIVGWTLLETMELGIAIIRNRSRLEKIAWVKETASDWSFLIGKSFSIVKTLIKRLWKKVA